MITTRTPLSIDDISARVGLIFAGLKVAGINQQPELPGRYERYR